MKVEKKYIYAGGAGVGLLALLWLLLRKKKDEEPPKPNVSGHVDNATSNSTSNTTTNTTTNATSNATSNASSNGSGYNFSLMILDDSGNASNNPGNDSMPENASTGTVPNVTEEATYNPQNGSGYNSSGNGGTAGSNVSGGGTNSTDIAGMPLETCAPVPKILIGSTVVAPVYTKAAKLWPVANTAYGQPGNCPGYKIALPGFDPVNTPGNSRDSLPGEPLNSPFRRAMCREWRMIFNQHLGKYTYSLEACDDPAKAAVEAAKDGRYLTIPITPR